jgi:bifunctional non-homologous end joining protein LigD
MLATLVASPFHKLGWVYEEKYDGVRLLAYKERDRVRLFSRNDIDKTDRFPAVAAAIEKLAAASLLLDGEVVVFDRKNVSRFQLLQRSEGYVVYAVFDCLYVNGQDLRRKPLSERREILEKTVPASKVLLLSWRLARDGLEAYEIAKRRGYEGVLAKDLSSPYVEKRSNFWLKVKVRHEDEFIIGGFTLPTGSRKYFGALLLGAYEKGRLRYIGKVGTGFTEETLATLYRKFLPLITKKPAFVYPPRERNATFLKPKLVAQVSYQEWTGDRKLRQAAFLGLREDKRPKDVILPENAT